MIRSAIRVIGPFLVGMGALIGLIVLMGGLSAPSGNVAAPVDSLDDDPLSTFELHPDFQIELIASEPLVADPIDMEIDEFGRLYVLEFHSYPTNWTGVDRIVLLRDTNGDGRMDERVVFADSLAQAMGIMRWKDGLIVAAPPNVIYLEDSDGDGRADIERIVLSGFHEGDGESDVNNPTYGLDNGIYLANGPRSESDIYFPDNPKGTRIPSAATARNIRFRPESFELEAQSSRTQYGLTFDRWGHPLLTNNRDHIYEEIIAARYLARNPDLLVSNAAESISDHGAATQVFPITTDPDYQILTDVGEITSACGITFYDGGAFPAEFENVSFVAEPAHNLIHADRIRSEGPKLTASRITPHTAFLASTDARFRPVNMYVGPDGALYVVDYYRTIIEGPTWLSDEVLQSGKLYEGTDQGRIYRITPKGTGPADWTDGLSLGDASNQELASHLDDPNAWWRLNAQRLLVDRAAVSVEPELRRMTRASSAAGRLHALWTLEGLGRLSTDLIQSSLQDDVAGVRENAIKLAERHLDQDLIDALLAMATDPDPKVRFQLLLTLGYIDTPRATEVRDDLLFDDVDNEWTQVAALSSPYLQDGDVLETTIERFRPEYASFVRRLSTLAAANRPWRSIEPLLLDALAPAAGLEWQAPVLEGLARGLAGRDSLLEDAAPQLDGIVATFFDHPSAPVRSAALQVLKATGLTPSESDLQRAVELTRDSDASAEARTQAIEFLLLDDQGRYVDLWQGLIDPGEPTSVQAAAFRALGAAPGTAVSSHAVQHWAVLTSHVRDAALDGILAYPFNRDRIVQLLDGIEEGVVHPAGIGWIHRVVLMRDIPDDLKSRARDLITEADEQIRHETAEFVRLVKEKQPDPESGRAVFYQQCARCHGLGEIARGGDVGPDLMSVRGWGSADIVDQVLRPNKAIARGYELWRLTLSGGDAASGRESVEGMIASETANAVTLRDANGRETTFARRSIESLTDLNAGVMPTNFGEILTHQEMADLAAFIRVGE